MSKTNWKASVDKVLNGILKQHENTKRVAYEGRIKDFRQVTIEKSFSSSRQYKKVLIESVEMLEDKTSLGPFNFSSSNVLSKAVKAFVDKQFDGAVTLARTLGKGGRNKEKEKESKNNSSEEKVKTKTEEEKKLEEQLRLEKKKLELAQTASKRKDLELNTKSKEIEKEKELTESLKSQISTLSDLNTTLKESLETVKKKHKEEMNDKTRLIEEQKKELNNTTLLLEKKEKDLLNKTNLLKEKEKELLNVTQQLQNMSLNTSKLNISFINSKKTALAVNDFKYFPAYLKLLKNYQDKMGSNSNALRAEVDKAHLQLVLAPARYKVVLAVIESLNAEKGEKQKSALTDLVLALFRGCEDQSIADAFDYVKKIKDVQLPESFQTLEKQHREVEEPKRKQFYLQAADVLCWGMKKTGIKLSNKHPMLFALNHFMKCLDFVSKEKMLPGSGQPFVVLDETQKEAFRKFLKQGLKKHQNKSAEDYVKEHAQSLLPEKVLN